MAGVCNPILKLFQPLEEQLVLSDNAINPRGLFLQKKNRREITFLISLLFMSCCFTDNTINQFNILTVTRHVSDKSKLVTSLSLFYHL